MFSTFFLPEFANNWPLLILIMVTGCVVGSFLNVLSLRLLREEEFIIKPSYCYQCETPLKWWDNIPVVSWLLLGGKCRNCKTGIHWQYPVIEILTGIVFVATLGVFGLTLKSLLLLWLFINLIVVLITDFREELIFEINSTWLIPAGLIYAAVIGAGDIYANNAVTGIITALLESFKAILLTYALFEILNMISCFSTKDWGTDEDHGDHGFGGGDSCLLMGVGAYFGMQAIVAIFIVGTLIQVIATLPFMVFNWLIHKRYKVIISFSVVLLLCFAFLRSLKSISTLNIDTWIILVLLILFFLAIVFSLWVWIQLSRKEEGLTYFPFGPALCIATVIYAFNAAYCYELLQKLYGFIISFSLAI